jgi:hypothetical protein
MGTSCKVQKGEMEFLLSYYDENGRFLWEDHNYRSQIKVGEVIVGEDADVYVVMSIKEKVIIKGLIERDIHLNSIGTTKLDPEYDVSVVQFNARESDGVGPVETIPITVKETGNRAKTLEKVKEEYPGMYEWFKDTPPRYTVVEVEMQEE